MRYINNTENYKFKGKWITSKEFASLDKIEVFHRYLDKVEVEKSKYQNRHILFRKSFELDTFNDAKIYIGADDCFKLYINGRFVCECFNQSCRAVDVKKYLHKGENLLAVHTYYQGLVNRVFVSADNCHGLICDLVIDGKTVLSSDETFLYSYHSAYKANGVLGYNTQFNEIYDASSNEVGFERNDFDDSSWQRSKISKNDNFTLGFLPTGQLVFEDIKANIKKTDYGYFVDFSKNYVGYFHFTAKGKKGGEVIIRLAQELEENGRVKYKMRSGCTYEDKLILSGNEDSFRQFDYKAFRYAEIILPSGADIDEGSVYLTARHYPFDLKDREFDDIRYEQLWRLCTHTLKYGIQENVLDCPDREKGYYLGDGCYIALTYAKLTGDAALFKQLIDDALKTKAVSPSLLTCLNCSLIQEIAEFPLIMIITASIYCSLTNDRAFAEKYIDDFKEILDYYQSEYASDILISKTDKWCVVEWPENFRDNYDVRLEQNELIDDTHCVINAYYYGALCAFNSLAQRSIYDTEKVKKAYLNAFYDKQRMCFCDSTRSRHSAFVSNAFSYAYGLCPDEETKEAIIGDIESRGITALSIFGVFPLLYKLKEDKRDISKHILNPDAWLNMIAQGATTTFEAWGKERKWNTSLFHLTLAYLAFFM